MFFISKMFVIKTLKWVFDYLYESFVVVWSNIWFHYEWQHNLFDFKWLDWWNFLWNIYFCLICKFQKNCNVSLEEFFFFQFKGWFYCFCEQQHGMFRPWLYFLPRKKTCILVSTRFYLGGVFCVFNVKMIIFMARVLVLSIKFSFHSISGFLTFPYFHIHS